MKTGHEPVLTVNMILSVIRSGLLMLIALDVFNLTDQQLEATMGFAAAVSLAVDAMANIWVRSRVAPVKKFRQSVQRAINKGKHEDVRAPAQAPSIRPPVDLPDGRQPLAAEQVDEQQIAGGITQG